MQTNHRLDILRIQKRFDDGFSNFVWGVRNGYPRATVFIFKNVSDNKVTMEHIIPANMDMMVFSIFVEKTIEALESSQTGTFCRIECRRHVYKDNRRTDELETTGNLVSGFDENGLYLSVIIDDKPKIKFHVPIPIYHTIQIGDSVLSNEEQNRFYGISYMKTVQQTISMLSGLHIDRLMYVEEKSKQQKETTTSTDDEIFF